MIITRNHAAVTNVGEKNEKHMGVRGGGDLADRHTARAHTHTQRHTAYLGREALKALMRAGMVSSGLRSANLKCDDFTGRCAGYCIGKFVTLPRAPVCPPPCVCVSLCIPCSQVSGQCSRKLPRSVSRREENEIWEGGGGG